MTEIFEPQIPETIASDQNLRDKISGDLLSNPQNARAISIDHTLSNEHPDIAKILSDRPLTEEVTAPTFGNPISARVFPEATLDSAESHALRNTADRVTKSLFQAADRVVVNPDDLGRRFNFIWGEGNSTINGSTDIFKATAKFHVLETSKRVLMTSGLTQDALRDQIITPALEKSLLAGRSVTMGNFTFALPNPSDRGGAVDIKGLGYISMQRTTGDTDRSLLADACRRAGIDFRKVGGLSGGSIPAEMLATNTATESLVIKGMQDIGGRGLLIAAGIIGIGYAFSKAVTA